MNYLHGGRNRDDPAFSRFSVDKNGLSYNFLIYIFEYVTRYLASIEKIVPQSIFIQPLQNKI